MGLTFVSADTRCRAPIVDGVGVPLAKPFSALGQGWRPLQRHETNTLLSSAHLPLSVVFSESPHQVVQQYVISPFDVAPSLAFVDDNAYPVHRTPGSSSRIRLESAHVRMCFANLSGFAPIVAPATRGSVFSPA